MSTKITPESKLKLSGELLKLAYKKHVDERSKFIVVLVGILFVSLLTYLSLSAMWGKFSRAEVFFAECVREMLKADTLVTPLYHGTPFFDKPIFSYWTIVASYQLFGISHFTSRIPSVLAAIATVGACGWGTRKLFGGKAGTLAAAILASSFMFLSFSNLCMSDMTLVLFDTLSLGLIYAASCCARLRTPLFWLAALSMGLAFLTKGPVGIVLPGISVVAYLTLTRQWRIVDIRNHVLPGIAILALAASPWFTAAWRENGAGALSYFFIHENLQRFSGSTYDTHKPIWFMVLSLLSGFLPWSLFLPLALKKSWHLWQENFHSPDSQKHLFLWLWIATVIGFFSLSRGKIDYYALPVYPACAILVGTYLSDAIEKKERWPLICAWIFAGIFTIAGVGAFFACLSLNKTPDYLSWIFVPTALFLGGICISYFAAQGDLRKVYKQTFVSICLTAMAFAFQIYPWIASQQAVLAYIPQIRSASEETRIGVHHELKNWIDEITFQTDKEPLAITSEKMSSLFLQTGGDALLLIPAKEYARLPLSVRESSRVIASRPFIKKSLNPLHLIGGIHKPESTIELLLVANH